MISYSQFSHICESTSLSVAQRAYQVLRSRPDLGFFDLSLLEKLARSIETLIAKLRKDCDQMVVLGIGGSSVGARAFLGALKTPAERVLFFESPDYDEFQQLVQKIRDPSRTALLLVSKSGSTIEMLTGYDFLQSHFNNQFKHIVAVTEQRSNPLYDWAQKHSYPCVEIPIHIGGRFSVLTPVGLLPLGFCGFSLQKILDGARAALKNEEDVSFFVAQALQSWTRQEWITMLFIYSQSLQLFGSWFEQLWAESLAKSHTRTGAVAPRVSTPMVAFGPADQHSLLQQVMEGAKDKWVIFVRNLAIENGSPLQQISFAKNEIMRGKSLGQLLAAEASGTQQALTQNEISNLRLTLQQSCEQDLGYLFMHFMLVVGTLSEALDIDGFNQPGVELGKRLAQDLLRS